jgi:hypothetical protein
MMRVLAVDHGSARAGCAISDPSGTIARPLGVVEPPEPGAVASVIAEHAAELVVVGLPVLMNGTEGAQARAAREFSDALAKLTDVLGSGGGKSRTRRPRRGPPSGVVSPRQALEDAGTGGRARGGGRG